MARLLTRMDDEWVSANAGRRHWSADEAARVLAACEQNERSIAAFARRHGLNPKRLYWWRARLSRGARRPTAAPRHEARSAAAAMSFVELRVAAAAPHGGDAGVVIEVGAHVRIAVAAPERVDATWLARVVAHVAAEAGA